MKTSELIEALAKTDSNPVRPAAPAARLVPASIAGALVALIVLALWLGFQSLTEAMRAPWFWMKWGYGAAAAIAGLAMAIPLSRPGGRVGRSGFIIAAVAVAALWLMAFHRVMGTEEAARSGLWLGHSWKACPWRILALAGPIWVAVVLAMRNLAPTRLVIAGAATGLMAGGVSVMVYGLYCRETAAPFVAAWYSLGIAASAGVGALLGPRFLKW